MQNRNDLYSITMAALLSVCCLSTFAQPTAFTYQGNLNDGAVPANGVFDLHFSAWNSASGPPQVGSSVTNIAVGVSNGLFTTKVDFGANIFTGSDLWLEIGVRSNSVGAFTTLNPRQQITPTPYAITAGDATSGNIARLNVPNTAVTAMGHPIVASGFIISAAVDNPGSGYPSAPSVTVNANGPGSGAVITATISGGSVTALNVINAGSGYTGSPTLTIGAPPSNNYQVFVTSNYFPNVNVFSSPDNVFMGDGSGLTSLNAGQLTSGQVSAGVLSNAWKVTGNGGTTAGTHFLGTTDNQPLELKVNNTRGLRLEPTTTNNFTSDIVNVIGGSAANTVGAGVFGATISGGGAVKYLGSASSNRVDADFGSLGGGRRNTIQSGSTSSTIGGGRDNTIQTNASESTIGGGIRNTIQPSASAIGGGSDNMIQTNAYASTIGGGIGNFILTNASYSTIGGGDGNTIRTGAHDSTIGGGFNNSIQPGAFVSAIGGGSSNAILGDHGTVPGGNQNVAGTNSFAAGNRAKANHTGAFVWADSTGADFASTANNQFSIRATGGVRLSDNTPNLSFGSTTRQMLNLFSTDYGLGVQDSTLYQRSNFRFSWFVGGTHSDSQNIPGSGGSVVMTLTPSGLTVNGSTCCTSDRNAKENFTCVEPREVLEKVAALPITRWNYKNDAGTPHLGPMAQDFYAAFGVGPDNKHIATVDADGVALAAIQGLNQKLSQKETEIAELKQRLEKIEILLNQKLNGGVK
jgi:hypothetical protein